MSQSLVWLGVTLASLRSKLWVSVTDSGIKVRLWTRGHWGLSPRLQLSGASHRPVQTGSLLLRAHSSLSVFLRFRR